MPRGYMEGPAAEEAERRAEEAARAKDEPPAPELHAAVYGCTEDDPEPHFLGWAGEVDPDELFATSAARGGTVRRVGVDAQPQDWLDERLERKGGERLEPGRLAGAERDRDLCD